jgi:hypothetical protein
MTTEKRQIAFYADDDVLKWYSAVTKGCGTSEINKRLRASFAMPASVFQQEPKGSLKTILNIGLRDLFALAFVCAGCSTMAYQNADEVIASRGARRDD